MKLRLSTIIPLVLLAYLGVMSYIGLPEFYNGNYLYYFGVIGLTLIIIFILHIYLKNREKAREENRRRRNLD